MTARALLLAIAALAAAQQPVQRPGVHAPRAQRPAAARCPQPGIWAAVRDSAWPLLAHSDGDSAWAHLEPDGLPRLSAAWCNPLDAQKTAADAGRSIYAQHCATCHGAAGKGDGPGAGAMLPAPFDFTASRFAGMREPPGPAVLYAIVARGIDGSTMRGFGELGPWERLAVLAYITRLPGDSALAAQKAWADSLKARRPR
ncbi:MAG: cytochrome c [Gemmatimonadales bacterium]|jgi:high-affinity iron transporter